MRAVRVGDFYPDEFTMTSQSLDHHALRLLRFIEDSVEEALSNPNAMSEPLSEADFALRLLQKALIKENPTKNAALMLLGVFDVNFLQIAKDNSTDPQPKLCAALETVREARHHFATA